MRSRYVFIIYCEHVCRFMTIKIKKILVPYDATASSRKALKQIFSLFEKQHPKIILFTCVRDKATFGFFKTKSDKQQIKQEKENAQKFHDDAKKEAHTFGLELSSKIVKSDLESKSIIEYAKKSDIDVIVMSKSKTLTHAERVYYNSTVDAVFKKTPCLFLYVP